MHFTHTHLTCHLGHAHPAEETTGEKEADLLVETAGKLRALKNVGIALQNSPTKVVVAVCESSEMCVV